MTQKWSSAMKVDLSLCRYLQRFGETVDDLDWAFAYLIKSLGGDQYYLCDQLPELGVISLELGEEVYEVVQRMAVTEIFELRNEIIDGFVTYLGDE